MTQFTTLISAPELQTLLASGQPCMVFDCSFDLMQPDAGTSQYLQAHIPGAVYAHLDTALSAKGDKTVTGAASGGRHPLPSRENFATWLGSVGFNNTTQAVVYDRQGVNYCGRLWWMLKWLGHDNVAVLDGGLQAWQAAGGAVSHGLETAKNKSNYVPAHAGYAQAAIETVAKNLGYATQNLIDARGAPRFRGEVEPLDPVAGHIPGALNRPFTANMGPAVAVTFLQRALTALNRNVEFGKAYKIQGTPTLIFQNGNRVPGAIDAAQIEKLLNESKS